MSQDHGADPENSTPPQGWVKHSHTLIAGSFPDEFHRRSLGPYPESVEQFRRWCVKQIEQIRRAMTEAKLPPEMRGVSVGMLATQAVDDAWTLLRFFGLPRRASKPAIADPTQLERWAEDAIQFLAECRFQCIAVLTAADRAEAYEIRLIGDFWQIRYGTEERHYKEGHAVAWLAKVLAAPRRSLTVADLFGDPEGKGAADVVLGNDRVGDRKKLREIGNHLADIEEVANQFGWSEELAKKKADLLSEMRAAPHALNPTLKRDHRNISTQLRTFRTKLAKEGMPLLAAHLKDALKLDYPHVGYYPDDPVPPWKF
jgi:hypothetical protein